MTTITTTKGNQISLEIVGLQLVATLGNMSVEVVPTATGLKSVQMVDGGLWLEIALGADQLVIANQINVERVAIIQASVAETDSERRLRRVTDGYAC